MDKLLSSIKVVEFGEGIAAPLAAQFLGDMGAEVIKVERPSGDWGRTMGHGNGEGSYHFLSLNRNKRTICLDVKTKEGLDIAIELIKEADILLTNYRPGTMEKLGLGYEQVKEFKPSIIYGRVSGYEYEGDLAKLPGSDTVLQAVSGIMSHIGDDKSDFYRTGFQVIDHTASRDLVIGVLAALFSRQVGESPEGPIDISLFTTGVGLQIQQWQEYFFTGAPPNRVGNKNSVLSPAGMYEVLNGEYITISVLRDEHFVKLCKALQLEHLLADERFATNELRLINRDLLEEELIPLFKTKSKQEWLHFLIEQDILVAPVNTIADIAQDEQLMKCIPFYKMKDTPLLNKYDQEEMDVIGFPIGLPNQSSVMKYHPPLKGEQTKEILKQLGKSEDTIQQLMDKGIIMQASIETKV